MKDTYLQTFAAAYDFPVVFTRGAFDPANRALVDAIDRLNEKRRHRVMAFLDAGVAQAQPDLRQRIRAYCAAFPDRLELVAAPHVVPGGETVKNDLRHAMEIVNLLLDHRMCRHSFVLVVGGGGALDAVGFAASLVHRGLRLVRVPTTVLAQNDSGVGVKTALNLGPGKNVIGTFAPPFAVVDDFALLETLPDAEWIGGIAEAFKVAIIKDAAFFDWLCEHAAELRGRNAAAMEHLVRRCAELHLEHIRTGGDPFEQGRARPLDFGHWAAHKLESMSGYKIGHGHAVATGLGLDACYAEAKGWLSPTELERIASGLRHSGFTLWRRELERKTEDGKLEILAGLRDFQEHLGGELYITFPNGIGRRHEVQEIDAQLVEDCTRRLKGLG